MNEDHKVREHYSKLASTWGLQGQMSMQDKVVRGRETTFIVNQLKAVLRDMGVAPEAARILDAGCGNGHLLAAIWEECAGPLLYGIEFVPELVALATSRNLPGLTITQGDMRKADDYPTDLHVIITERSIINLQRWEWQAQAFTHIARALRPGGHYIMVESFHESWEAMNKLREESGLPLVPMASHNRFLKEACVDTLAQLGLREIQAVEEKHALSSHFFLSRIFQHLFTSPEGKPASEEIWKFFAQALPPDIGTYSPILFRVFRKDA